MLSRFRLAANPNQTTETSLQGRAFFEPYFQHHQYGEGRTMEVSPVQESSFRQSGLRKLKRGRAPGPNSVPQLCSKQAVKLLHANLWPCSPNAPPTPMNRWTGRADACIRFTKGNPTQLILKDIGRYSSHFTAKLYHMTLRQPLEAARTQRIHSLQLGGRKGRSRHGASLASKALGFPAAPTGSRYFL